MPRSKSPLAPAPAQSSAATARFVGRQPILDRQQRVFGYELLFRSSLDNWAKSDSESISRQVIDNMLLLGIDTVAAGGMAFVNCDREALLDQTFTLLPAASTVVEVLETVEVDDDIYAACKAAKDLGYQIALDDFLPGTESDRLIELADLIKLDFRASSSEGLRKIQDRLLRTDLSLLAEKVETEQEFQRALADGYSYFQGYFFSRPTILQGTDIPANHLIYIQLLGAISATPFDLDEVERLVLAETSLCFRVLRMVNSAASGLRAQITSIRQAMLLLGEVRVSRLISVAAAASLGRANHAPSEMILRALHRARFCELLAPAAHQSSGEQYLIGLFFSLDALLRVPMENIVKMLPLRPDVVCALLGSSRPVSLPLRLFQAYEEHDGTRIEQLGATLRLSQCTVTTLYVDSLQWATHQTSVELPD